jgi:hypothetical protein
LPLFSRLSAGAIVEQMSKLIDFRAKRIDRLESRLDRLELLVDEINQLAMQMTLVQTAPPSRPALRVIDGPQREG